MIAQPPIPDPIPSAPAASSVPCPLSTDPSPLSPTDRTLLYTYFELQENLAALATHLAANPLPAPEHPDAHDSPAVPCPLSTVPSDYFSLLTWLNQPHIQSALDAHHQAVARADRRAALDGIRKSLESADNPTNLRRAATTLLRSTLARTTPTVNPDRKAEGSPRRGGAQSASHPSDTPPIQNPQSKIQNHTHSPLPPLAPLPPPTSRPTPNPDPRPAFAAIAAALMAPQLPVALSSLHAHASPTATFAGNPIPPDPATWAAALHQNLPADFTLPLEISDAREIEPADSSIQNPQSKIQNPSTSRWHFWTRGRHAKHFQCALTLIRDGPDHPDPSWRLASFDILRRSG